MYELLIAIVIGTVFVLTRVLRHKPNKRASHDYAFKKGRESLSVLLIASLIVIAFGLLNWFFKGNDVVVPICQISIASTAFTGVGTFLFLQLQSLRLSPYIQYATRMEMMHRSGFKLALCSILGLLLISVIYVICAFLWLHDVSLVQQVCTWIATTLACGIPVGWGLALLGQGLSYFERVSD